MRCRYFTPVCLTCWLKSSSGKQYVPRGKVFGRPARNVQHRSTSDSICHLRSKMDEREGETVDMAACECNCVYDLVLTGFLSPNAITIVSNGKVSRSINILARTLLYIYWNASIANIFVIAIESIYAIRMLIYYILYTRIFHSNAKEGCWNTQHIMCFMYAH